MAPLEDGYGQELLTWADRYVREKVGYHIVLAFLLRHGEWTNNATERANEVVHEVVMYVVKTGRDGNPIENYEHFERTVNGLLAKRAVDPYRREKRHHRNRVPLSDTTDDLGTAEESPSPVDEAEREELRTLVRQTLDQLSARDQTLIRLRFDEELTFAEISEMLGTKLQKAYADYRRLLTRLRKILRDKIQLG